MHKGELHDSKLAELKTPNFIHIRDFDGLKHSYKMSGGSIRWSSTISKILPGHHSFTAYYAGYGSSSNDMKFEFDALPGENYELKYEIGPVLRSERSGGPPPLPGSTTQTRSFRMWIEHDGKAIAWGSVLYHECNEKLPLRCDGIYQSEKEEGSWEYARFYDDGTVITVNTTGSPSQVVEWLEKGKMNVYHGKYEIKGNRLNFSSKSKYGIVDYEGIIQEDTLILNIHSHINDRQSKRIYRFLKFYIPR